MRSDTYIISNKTSSSSSSSTIFHSCLVFSEPSFPFLCQSHPQHSNILNNRKTFFTHFLTNYPICDYTTKALKSRVPLQDTKQAAVLQNFTGTFASLVQTCWWELLTNIGTEPDRKVTLLIRLCTYKQFPQKWLSGLLCVETICPEIRGQIMNAE